jgi:hypothetical protein
MEDEYVTCHITSISATTGDQGAFSNPNIRH